MLYTHVSAPLWKMYKRQTHTTHTLTQTIPNDGDGEGYGEIYLMKLVQAHVMTVDPYGPIMENFMMENKNFDAIPYGHFWLILILKF